MGKRICRPGRARLNACRRAQSIDCGCQGLIQGAWVPSAEVLSARALGGACWVSQGVAPLLGSPSTLSCLLPGVAEAGTLAPSMGKGSGRSWVQAEKLQRREIEDSGVRVLQLEANVNMRFS